MPEGYNIDPEMDCARRLMSVATQNSIRIGRAVHFDDARPWQAVRKCSKATPRDKRIRSAFPASKRASFRQCQFGGGLTLDLGTGRTTSRCSDGRWEVLTEGDALFLVGARDRACIPKRHDLLDEGRKIDRRGASLNPISSRRGIRAVAGAKNRSLNRSILAAACWSGWGASAKANGGARRTTTCACDAPKADHAVANPDIPRILYQLALRPRSSTAATYGYKAYAVRRLTHDRVPLDGTLAAGPAALRPRVRRQAGHFLQVGSTKGRFRHAREHRDGDERFGNEVNGGGCLQSGWAGRIRNFEMLLLAGNVPSPSRWLTEAGGRIGHYFVGPPS